MTTQATPISSSISEFQDLLKAITELSLKLDKFDKTVDERFASIETKMETVSEKVDKKIASITLHPSTVHKEVSAKIEAATSALSSDLKTISAVQDEHSKQIQEMKLSDKELKDSVSNLKTNDSNHKDNLAAYNINAEINNSNILTLNKNVNDTKASLKDLATDTATFKATLQTKFQMFQDNVTHYLTDKNNRVLMKQEKAIDAYQKRTNEQLESIEFFFNEQLALLNGTFSNDQGRLVSQLNKDIDKRFSTYADALNLLRSNYLQISPLRYQYLGYDPFPLLKVQTFGNH